MTRPLLTLTLDREEDVVAARQRARRLAGLLGFEAQDQTRIATAVSEIARNAVVYAGGGKVAFALEEAGGAQALEVRVSDRGPGIADLDAVLEGRYASPTGMGLGLVGTRRLMDGFLVEPNPGGGTVVRFAKRLPRGSAIRRESLASLAAALAADGVPDPLAEAREQNRELLASLSELRARQDDLNRLNAELEDTNRGVVALYAELDERAEELRRASEMKSRFLSDMSHEFRTPLNSILALSRLLLERADGELTPEQERQVGYIRRSAQSLTDLVNDLLDIAKVEAGKVELRPRRFTVAELFGALRGVLKPLQTTDAVELVFDDDDHVAPLFTDEGKLSQILRNLISNALKFTERGSVRVTAHRDATLSSVTFAVTDTGIGIAPEDQERIFEEFAQVETRLQLRVKGTGLGLSLSRKLARLLEGELTVRSELGKGSVFSLTIPAQLPETGAERSPGPAEAARSGPRILIVDDEEPSRYVLRHLASGYGAVELIEASDGAEGLRRAQADRPDLILLDLRMPGGPDGFEVLQRLGEDEATRSIPVVVCTSSVLGSTERRRLARAATVIAKSSLSQETLHSALGEALARSEKAQ
ncbi:ATP-binding protein [Falsiroseomonas sp. HW251]|uniref:ATP-binding protein n=1 Tax=Falsiroseomonas sp. HW251 TaxID=3390998 RepID=UPI003D31EE0B